MLVLTRRKEERIIIGDVVVVIADIRGDRVRIGIEAPPEVPVHREEVFERIRAGAPQARITRDREASELKRPPLALRRRRS